MTEQLFIRILNMSLTGTFVILGVMAVRLLLRKVPRVFSYCLWIVVLFRLLCPVSFTTAFSPLSALHTPSVQNGRMEYIPEDIAQLGLSSEPFLAVGADNVTDTPLQGGSSTSVANEKLIITELMIMAGTGTWLLGIGIMAVYSIVTLIRLKLKLKNAVWERDNIYITDKVSTPFVIGLARPKIYLPDALGREEKRYILMHEQIHIKRKDHIVKFISFLTLCIHWFNPLVWAAFFLSGEDMEMSCDEAVIRKIGSGVKKKYTTSLLSMATGKRIVNGIPLAFGEGDTGSRIKNVLRYKKPTVIVAFITAAVCIAAAVLLSANPKRNTSEAVNDSSRSIYYGVVSEIAIDPSHGENVQRLLIVPGIGEIEIPAADSIYTYFERDEQELLMGDLVAVTFPEDEEIAILETWPGRFSQSAESIGVIWSGFYLQSANDNSYRLTFPGGVVPGVTDVKEGDILSIYWEEPEYPAYLTQVPKSDHSALLLLAPILAIDENEYGGKMLTIEASTEKIYDILSGFGFHTRFALESEDSFADTHTDEEIQAYLELRQQLAEEIQKQLELRQQLAEEMKRMEEQMQRLRSEKQSELNAGAAAGGDTYRISVRSISRSSKTIDTYVTDADSNFDGDEPLAFAEDCIFKINYSMDGIDYRTVSFDTFADVIGDAPHMLNKPCLLTFKDDLIVEAVLESAWVSYGISFDRFVPLDYYYDNLVEQEGKDSFEKYYSLASTQTLDISDCEGKEIIEVYTGNTMDGESGIVMFKNEKGELLCNQSAHISRAGWNNIYLGENEDGAFIMNVYIEDRENFGGYGYWIDRLDEEGGIKQIAGSRFDFALGGDILKYDDDLFKEWADNMTSWLEDSYLILSSQGGEIRTEKISEADKYNYETLSLKDR